MKKNDVEVVINGKQYTLCGYESSDYLQHIATHINEKYADFKQQEGYNRLDTGMRNILLAINLTDDYFKAQKQAGELKEQKEDLEKEIFEIRHKLLSAQSEAENLKKQLEETKKSYEEASRQVIRLETELKHEQKEADPANVAQDERGNNRSRKNR